MGDVVRGSAPAQPLLRKYRNFLYDEEKVGDGNTYNQIQLFVRRVGELDNAGHQKTYRDTNMIQNGALGSRQEFYLVGINWTPDWHILTVDERTAAAGFANNELEVLQRMTTDSLFELQFGRGQPLVQLPLERIPYGNGPNGVIMNNTGAADVSHLITQGVPSVREFLDLRLRKTRPRHIQPEQAFSVTISWPNGTDALGNWPPPTFGTDSGNEWYRLTVYLVGILLSTL
jgi:hypothetical protein